jgi:hypothetical protein
MPWVSIAQYRRSPRRVPSQTKPATIGKTFRDISNQHGRDSTARVNKPSMKGAALCTAIVSFGFVVKFTSASNLCKTRDDGRVYDATIKRAWGGDNLTQDARLVAARVARTGEIAIE